jgi:hypothetical protein
MVSEPANELRFRRNSAEIATQPHRVLLTVRGISPPVYGNSSKGDSFCCRRTEDGYDAAETQREPPQIGCERSHLSSLIHRRFSELLPQTIEKTNPKLEANWFPKCNTPSALQTSAATLRLGLNEGTEEKIAGVAFAELYPRDVRPLQPLNGLVVRASE